MARTAWAIGVSWILLSCAAGARRPLARTDRVVRALEAMGGVDRAASIETLTARGTARHREPEQSVKADGEMRFAGESKMLIGDVPDARIGFVVDLWSPGRDKLGDQLTPGQAALLAAVNKLSSTPERLAGGHGTVAEYAPLAALGVPRHATR
jgi:hypothetical protein